MLKGTKDLRTINFKCFVGNNYNTAIGGVCTYNAANAVSPLGLYPSATPPMPQRLYMSCFSEVAPMPLRHWGCIHLQRRQRRLAIGGVSICNAANAAAPLHVYFSEVAPMPLHHWGCMHLQRRQRRPAIGGVCICNAANAAAPLHVMLL